MTVACSVCGREVDLPGAPHRPGWVDIRPLTGWTAPPLRCPDCAEAPE